MASCTNFVVSIPYHSEQVTYPGGFDIKRSEVGVVQQGGGVDVDGRLVPAYLTQIGAGHHTPCRRACNTMTTSVRYIAAILASPVFPNTSLQFSKQKCILVQNMCIFFQYIIVFYKTIGFPRWFYSLNRVRFLYVNDGYTYMSREYEKGHCERFALYGIYKQSFSPRLVAVPAA